MLAEQGEIQSKKKADMKNEQDAMKISISFNFSYLPRERERMRKHDVGMG